MRARTAPAFLVILALVSIERLVAHAGTSFDEQLLRVSIYRTLGLAVFAAVPVLSAQSPTTTPQTTGTGLIAGQVIDHSTGGSLGGAVVTLVTMAPSTSGGTESPPTAQARRGVAVTNTDGRFVFRDIPAGLYVLTSTLDGYAPGASGRRRPGAIGRPFTIANGARITDARIAMWRLSSISGHVYDDLGEPAIGVTVWAYRPVMDGGRLELTLGGGGVQATDDRGYYELSGLMPGTYVVGIRSNPMTIAASTADAYRAAVTSGTTATITSRWPETGAIQIQGRGLTIGDWVLHYDSGQPQPLPGPDGKVLRHPNMFHANAMKASQATPLTLAAGEQRTGIDMTLPLAAGVRVSGRLLAPEGAAAHHGIRLFLADDGEPAHEIPAAYATTDAVGRFAFLGVTPGSYVVRAYRTQPSGLAMRFAPPAAGAPPIENVQRVTPQADPPQPLFAEMPVSVGTSHIDDLSLGLQPGSRVTGRVVFDGTTRPDPQRLQQIMFNVRPVIGPVAEVTARVDAEGRFAFAGFPSGRHMLTAVSPPGAEWALGTFIVGGVDASGQAFTVEKTDITDAVATFTNKEIVLSGTVRTADGAAGTEGTVVVFPADAQDWMRTGMSMRRIATAAVADAGTYRVRIAVSGDYVVVALPPEIAPDIDRTFIERFAPSAVRVSLKPGESKTQALTIVRVK